MSRVAVRINDYSHERWLREAVEWVPAQTRRPDEVMVYADGGTDDAGEILRLRGDRIHLPEGGHDFGRRPIASAARALATGRGASADEHGYLPEKIAHDEEEGVRKPEAVMVKRRG
jgi:hypothetical protein